MNARGRLSKYDSNQLNSMMRDRFPLMPPMVSDLLEIGFDHFNQRVDQLKTLGIRFRRIAGQVIDTTDLSTRNEIKQTLENLTEGGVLISLGHGGKTCLSCGAVSSKKKQIELASKGQTLTTEPYIVNLLGHINPGVTRFDSPDAEMFNAVDQLAKILVDSEFGEIIKRKNLTVVAGVFTENGTVFKTVTLEDSAHPKSQDLDDSTIHSKFPKLQILRDNLARGIKKAKESNISLEKHYAHSIMLFDPYEIASVMDANTPVEVAGFCCVDARLQPNTPGNPRSFLGIGPNEVFGVTAQFTPASNLDSLIIANDLGSIDYALGHVSGINQIPNFITVATTLEGASSLKMELLKVPKYREATNNGKHIITVSFSPKNGLWIQTPDYADVRVSYTGSLYK